MLLLVRFYVFYVFSNLYLRFCRVSYVFSKYDLRQIRWDICHTSYTVKICTICLWGLLFAAPCGASTSTCVLRPRFVVHPWAFYETKSDKWAKLCTRFTPTDVYMVTSPGYATSSLSVRCWALMSEDMSTVSPSSFDCNLLPNRVPPC